MTDKAPKKYYLKVEFNNGHKLFGEEFDAIDDPLLMIENEYRVSGVGIDYRFPRATVLCIKVGRMPITSE